MYCNNCGKEITDDSEFCGFCGVTVPASAPQTGLPATPPTPPIMATAPAAPAQPGPFAPPPGKSTLPWVLGGIGLIVVVAVVLVLVLVTSNDESSVDTSGPEQVTGDTGTSNDKGTGDTSTGNGQQADQLAEVEEAMLEYAYANSADGLEFGMISLAINGNEAVGVVKCTNQSLESPMAYMKKGSGGWYGIDFGTGGELPSWYEQEERDLKASMLDYLGTKASPGQTFEITNLLIWGDNAACVAICTNRNVDDKLVVMKKGSRGWYGVDQGSELDRPYWYWPDL